MLRGGKTKNGEKACLLPWASKWRWKKKKEGRKDGRMDGGEREGVTRTVSLFLSLSLSTDGGYPSADNDGGKRSSGGRAEWNGNGHVVESRARKARGGEGGRMFRFWRIFVLSIKGSRAHGRGFLFAIFTILKHHGLDVEITNCVNSYRKIFKIFNQS